jgi:hypothetical protein
VADERQPKVGEWMYVWEDGKLVAYQIQDFRKAGSRFDNPDWVRGKGHGKNGRQGSFERAKLTWDSTLSGWRYKK